MSLFLYYYSTSLLPRNCHCYQSIPCYYNERHSHLLKEIYELHSNIENRCVETVPEYLCSSITFGYENNNSIILNEKDGNNNDNDNNNNGKRIILIVDMGYIDTYVTLNKYSKNKCEIINTIYDDNLGGRYIDKILIDYIIEKIKEERGIDIRKNILENDNHSNKKYNNILKVMNDAKEKLSANGADTVSIVIENIFDDDDNDNDDDDDEFDEDYSGTFSIEELDKILIEDQVLNRLLNLVKKSVEEGKLNDVEKKKLEISIIGGSLRTKLFQTELSKLLKEIRSENNNNDNNKEENEEENEEEKENNDSQLPSLNLTMNMDEAVCNGSVYYGLYKQKIWKYEVEDHKRIINESKNRENNELYVNKEKIDIDVIRSCVFDIIHPHLLTLLYLHIRNDVESFIYDFNREMSNIPSNIPIDNINTRKDDFLKELKKKNSKLNTVENMRIGFNEFISQLKDVRVYTNKIGEYEEIINRKCEKYSVMLIIPNLIKESKRKYKSQIDQIIRYETEYLYYRPTEDDLSQYILIADLIKNPPVVSLPLVGISLLKIDGMELMNEYNKNIEMNSEYSLNMCEESFLLHNYFVKKGFPCEFYRNNKIHCFSGCSAMYRILERMKKYEILLF